jgi:hypothetical protein
MDFSKFEITEVVFTVIVRLTKLAPRTTIRLEKLINSQLAKNLPASHPLYGTSRLILCWV